MRSAATLLAEPGLAERPSATRAEGALRRMREDILACALAPGAKLPFETLRAAYGVSFSTLREALTRLAADGLVVAEGQRGFRVAPVSRADLLDLTHARVVVEREALRLAMRNGDDAWEGAMLSAFHRMDRLQVRIGKGYARSPGWSELHGAFHLSLVSACGSPVLLGIRETLFERAHRYRALSAQHRPGERGKGAEHRAILDATLARDERQALDRIERHIRATTDTVLAYAAHLFEDRPPDRRAGAWGGDEPGTTGEETE